MRKKAGLKGYRLLPLLLAVFLLAGCGSFELPFDKEAGTEGREESETGTASEETGEEETGEQESENGVSGVSQELQQIEGHEEEEGGDKPSKKELEEKRDAAGLSESDIPGLKLEQSGNYYFEQCNDEEKTLYVELYRILDIQGTELLVSVTDPDLLAKVYQCVINDHPELFYLNGYTYTQYTRQGAVQYLTFSGRYLYEPKEVEMRQNKIDAVVAENWDRLVGADEYETVKAVYEYLIFETDYSMDSPDNQNICSVFLDKKSVCNGYAKAAQYLLNQFGIPCIIVNGNAGGLHAWNIVEIDGEYYHMDTTWGDPSFHPTDGAEDIAAPDIDYGYFCVTTAEICKNHTIDTTFAVPECTATAANYFIREGLYLNGFEEEKLRQIFEQARNDGKKSVVIKAADRQAYDELVKNLIDEQKIFEYFDGYGENGNQLAYSGNEELYTLHFWR